MSFSFSTSNPYHPSKLGAWTITLTETGSLTASWLRQAHKTNFGPYWLTSEENQHIWGLIHQTNLVALSSSTRMGIPDEVMYTFTVESDKETRSVWMWMSDIQSAPSLRKLVAELSQVLENLTGQKPHLHA